MRTLDITLASCTLNDHICFDNIDCCSGFCNASGFCETPPCDYFKSPDGCSSTSEWCWEGACTSCTAGFLNCDQTQGCEVSGNVCGALPPPAPLIADAPTVLTQSTDSITASSVNLNSSISPNGFDTNAWFLYGFSALFSCDETNTSVTKIPLSGSAIGSGTSSITFSQTISSLGASDYSFCAIAENTVGKTLGSTLSFTITGIAPTNTPIPTPIPLPTPIPTPIPILTFWGDIQCVADGVATLDCIPGVLKLVIQSLLMFAGIVAVFLIVHSGAKFVLSSGDPKKVEEARNTLVYAVLGLIIIAAAYLIVNLVSFVTGVKCIKFIGFNCT